MTALNPFLDRFFSNFNDEDLIRCTLVNSLWRKVALKILARRTEQKGNVKLYIRDSLVAIFTLTMSSLVVHLDLTEAVLPDYSSHHIIRHRLVTNDDFWNRFYRCIKNLQQLRIIELRSCPARILENLSRTHSLLRKIKSLNSIGPVMNIVHLMEFRNLQELHLQFDYRKGVIFIFDNQSNERLNNITNLALTGINNLYIPSILEVVNFDHLRALSLGSFSKFPQEFETILTNLKQLEKLRLEGLRHHTVITTFHAVATLENLKHLEMIDIDIPYGADEAIARCVNLTRLLISPNPENLSSFNNRTILCGIVKLYENLKRFEWVFARDSFSESWDDIIILGKLPYLDERGSIQIPSAMEENLIIFDQDALKTFIELFIPDCIVSIEKTTYAKSFCLQLQ
ncbi:hypothetical protein ILUMI_20039 [Ignelater luminosus]|uniref:F-box domain-containing protein n=1 Tax=Ignelater luminosus TaxID=2038154 RepID=A0A8K0CF10_IGNLU|nr:hypothetical protein ILUMI_20039 [Ignelater luminosus]